MQDYFLKGFVGASPEIVTLQGFRVCKFIIAANCGPAVRPKKIWVRCTAWRDLADRVKANIFQGDLVAINGRIADVEAWIDAKGKAKGALAVTVSQVFKSTKPGLFEDIKPKTYERLPKPGGVDEDVPF